jgi:pantoate--beta-alanine ligase
VLFCSQNRRDKITEMKIINTIDALRKELKIARENKKSIGLVPTMGALHAGHASLVKRSVAENDVTVVSIFVNPTQFNDKNDLKKYPRTLESDAKLLESVGATYAFAPSVEEMYPETDTRKFDFSPLDKVMEGPRRPGHFNGVAQIVSKLFYAVEPDRAYFGEKDFQQVAIIRKMVEQLNLKLQIVSCPIVREVDGLALSSRNKLMNEGERKTALNISKTLFASQEFAKNHTLVETKNFVKDGINATKGLELEYYDIVNGNTLQDVKDWQEADYIVGCITVHCGNVRLIDNIKYKEIKK